LDLQQQRVERAVGEELKATPTVITKTGLFDNIDKLYGSMTGATPAAGAATTPDGGEELAPPPIPAGGEVPGGEPELAPPTEAPPAGGEVTPESKMKDLNILVENNLIEGAEMINLGQAQDSLGEISKELDKLLNS